MISDRQLLRRADELAAITETPPTLARTDPTPEHRRTPELVMGWIHGAGMRARLDEVGNAAGRHEGATPGAPRLMDRIAACCLSRFTRDVAPGPRQ